ncbi:hypothetical protein [Nitratireductor thuwali]|uniref:GatB/YqeY domain-containing protein n=1 Tax=Nitratireductor thuwali TaxID=2267699 RepID=A0ABY5MP64_9HYPH|nr:hypothetical protein NTH_03727 [Nitratireductor thuwali]
MRSRLRANLGLAMKLARKREAALIRELIAAIDNAEAAPGLSEPASVVRHDFRDRSAEAERRLLSREEVRALVSREIEKRAHAAAEFDRLGKAEEAAALRAEIQMARRYVEE